MCPEFIFFAISFLKHHPDNVFIFAPKAATVFDVAL